MSEQWYLDLDGVRSGPYQTSEVMSLVAEGEILPHHQIATELKSQKWMTILEWRLNQNKSVVTEPKVTEPAAVTTATTVTKEVPPVVEKPEVIIEKPEVKSAPPTITPPPHSPAPPKAPTPSTEISPVANKRDPMAEMFDMLQNTKQKREIKSQQSHANAHHAHTHPHTAPSAPASTTTESTSSSSSSLFKTIAIGLVVTVIGFALGQLFQRQKLAPTQQTASIQTPTPASSPSPKAETMSEATTVETIDRSTDKMTIRARAPVMNNAAEASPSPVEHSKDIQELKDLKKELLELKALKEEIRGNGEPERMGSPSRTMDPNMEMDPNAIEDEDEEGANPQSPGPNNNNIHY